MFLIFLYIFLINYFEFFVVQENMSDNLYVDITKLIPIRQKSKDFKISRFQDYLLIVRIF